MDTHSVVNFAFIYRAANSPPLLADLYSVILVNAFSQPLFRSASPAVNQYIENLLRLGVLQDAKGSLSAVTSFIIKFMTSSSAVLPPSEVFINRALAFSGTSMNLEIFTFATRRDWCTRRVIYFECK